MSEAIFREGIDCSPENVRQWIAETERQKARAEAAERSYENQRVAAEQIAVNLRDALARAEAAERAANEQEARAEYYTGLLDDAEAKVARVEALRDQWDEDGSDFLTYDAAERLAVALNGDDA